MQDSTPKGTRIAHVGIAVRSIAELVPFYRDVLGLPAAELADSDGARIAGFSASGSLVELLEPDDSAGPVSRFIERKGPGIHHICFAVDDIDEALARCRASGMRLVDETPRIGAEGKRIAFIHPASTGGVLVELSEH